MSTLNAHAAVLRSTRHPDFTERKWSLTTAWREVELIDKAILRKDKDVIAAAPFFAWSCGESTDNARFSPMTVHVYILNDWQRKSIFVALDHLEMPADAKSLKKQLADALQKEAGLTSADVLACGCMFAADGAAVLQGQHGGVTQLFRDEDVPKLVGLHRMAHHVQLEAKSTSKCIPMGRVLALTTNAAKFDSKSPTSDEVRCLLSGVCALVELLLVVA